MSNIKKLFPLNSIGKNMLNLNGDGHYPPGTLVILLNVRELKGILGETKAWFILGDNYKNSSSRGNYWSCYHNDDTVNGLFELVSFENSSPLIKHLAGLTQR